MRNLCQLLVIMPILSKCSRTDWWFVLKSSQVWTSSWQVSSYLYPPCSLWRWGTTYRSIWCPQERERRKEKVEYWRLGGRGLRYKVERRNAAVTEGKSSKFWWRMLGKIEGKQWKTGMWILWEWCHVHLKKNLCSSLDAKIHAESFVVVVVLLFIYLLSCAKCLNNHKFPCNRILLILLK